MERKKLGFMNIKQEDTLSRDDMRSILAGSGGSSNVCRIYSNGSWGGCSWTASEAQAWYNNHPDVTGYCCENCAESCY